MCFADANRALEMVLYNPAAAASQQRANKRARQDDEAAANAKSSSSPSPSSATAASPSGAMVPYAGTSVLDVAPISVAPPPLKLRRPPPRPAAGAGIRREHPCLRRHFLLALGLRADLPVHFIDDKCVTSTDLDPHQNRFRIPRDGVDRHLLPILTPQELDAANLLEDPVLPPRPKKRPRQEQEQEQELQLQLQLQQPGPSSEAQAQQDGKKVKKPKKKGKVHGGLRVKLVGLDAGVKELLMARWTSSQGTILKGEGYLHFIRRCGLKEKDDVEIWAFVQRRFHLFGKDLCDDSLLHILVVKKQANEEPRCCLCRAPAHHVPVPPPSASPMLQAAPTPGT